MDEKDLNAAGVLSKNSPVIRFRGRMDHAEAVVILAQMKLAAELDFQEGRPVGETRELIGNLQEVLEVLRACVTAEYRGTELTVETLFGLPLDELQYRSHHAEEFYGVPTMTRPDYRFGETYAYLNLVRTEIRLAEEEVAALDRPDLLHILNRLSSAAHVLMCRYLGEQKTN